MGARPIAVLDSLRFGPITSGTSGAKALEDEPQTAGLKPGPPKLQAEAGLVTKTEAGRTGFSPSDRLGPGGALAPEVVDEAALARNRRILDGVVRGIAHYGNCFGVPTVGGEVQFEPGYSANPLVNVLALGIAKKEDLFFAKARGVGNPVIYVGAKTGRDGIHGASLLASAEFTEESQQKRPNVQVGDPFMEKLLLEACLEAMQTGAVVAIQDMGAAGLTSTSCEMASRGGLGIEIELARVPQREPGMTPYEMMLSESQERMLLVAERGREQEVFKVFAKWGLDAVEIGRVTEDGLVRVLHHAKVVAEIPAHALAEEGPVYQRPLAAPRADPAAEPRLVEFSAPDENLTEQFPRIARSARDCLEALDLGAIRLHGAHQYNRSSGSGRRRRRAHQGHQTRARACIRRQRPLVPPRSVRRRATCRGRSRAQRGLLGREAHGRDQLPQFWQPRKAGSDVAIQPRN